MKTQSEQNARRTTGAVESSGNQVGGAVGRTAARAGQHPEAADGTEAKASPTDEAPVVPLFPDIAERRDFPLALCNVTWCTAAPGLVN